MPNFLCCFDSLHWLDSLLGDVHHNLFRMALLRTVQLGGGPKYYLRNASAFDLGLSAWVNFEGSQQVRRRGRRCVFRARFPRVDVPARANARMPAQVVPKMVQIDQKLA